MFRSGLIYNNDDVTDVKSVADLELDVEGDGSKSPKARARGKTFIAGGIGPGGQTLTKNIWQVCLYFFLKERFLGSFLWKAQYISSKVER